MDDKTKKAWILSAVLAVASGVDLQHHLDAEVAEGKMPESYVPEFRARYRRTIREVARHLRERAQQVLDSLDTCGALENAPWYVAYTTDTGVNEPIEEFETEAEATAHASHLVTTGRARIARVYKSAWDPQDHIWVPDLWSGSVHTFQ